MRANLALAVAVLTAGVSNVLAAASVNLTDQQKQSIQQSLASRPAQQQPTGFTAQLGEKVPSSVKLNKLPGQLVQQVPSVKNDEFAKFTNNEIVIVNPTDKKVLAIVGQNSTTGAKAGSTMQKSTSSK
jgi:hypothetical protein